MNDPVQRPDPPYAQCHYQSLMQTNETKYGLPLTSFRLLPEIILCLATFFIFLYLLGPWRIWDGSIHAGYVEIIFHSILLSGGALAFIGILHLFGYRDSTVHFSSMDLILIFVLMGLLARACFSTANPEIIIGWFGLAFFYVLLRNIHPEHIGVMMYVFPIALVGQLIYGIKAQTAYFMPGKGLELITGSFTNTAMWGEFAGINVLLATIRLFYRRSLSSSLLWGLTLLLAVFLLFTSDSRAAWLATIIGVAYIVYDRLRNKIEHIKTKQRRTIGVSLVAIATIVFVGLYFYKIESANGRLLIWQVAGRMFCDKPLIGFGTDGFRKNYMTYQEEYFRQEPHSIFEPLASNNLFAFNELLSTGVEYGIIGLALLVFIFYRLIRRTPSSPTKDPSTPLAARAGVLSFAIFGLFSYPFNIWQLMLVLIFFMACISLAEETKIHLKCAKALFGIGILAGILLHFSLLQPYRKAFLQWSKALTSNAPNDTALLNTLQEVRPILELHPSFLLDYGLHLRRNGHNAEAAEVLQRSLHLYPTYIVNIELGKSLAECERHQEAERAWTSASHMIPHKFMPLYLKMQTSLKQGDLTKARKIADNILTKPIKLYSPGLNKILRETKKLKKELDKEIGSKNNETMNAREHLPSEDKTKFTSNR